MSLKELKIKLIKIQIAYLNYLVNKKKIMEGHTENSLKIYETAKSLLGTRIAPYDARTDYGVLGCAATVSVIIRKATGYLIGGDGFVEGTSELYDCFINSGKFIETEDPLSGDIIICVTATGNGKLTNGHTGIVGKFGILSNNSENGRLQEKLSFESWRAIYEIYGGYKTYYFRML